uniref:Uncharacterized protein n=1 Tax=Nicotiana tabacum TaxID=4097 RepID=A0A1S3XW82_TOBAC|nr:PREDICTED: uncharacterized protein LOC107769433 [Nicotiana tabacum]
MKGLKLMLIQIGDLPEVAFSLIKGPNGQGNKGFQSSNRFDSGGKVDHGSSSNIIQWRVLEQAKLTENIVSATKLLAGFNLTIVITRGEILLTTHAEGIKNTTMFEVVDGDMGYNVILARPWIHEMKVPSTYHQLLKFPTPEVVKQIRGDQPATREMNVVPRSFQVPEETDAIKSTTEELEQMSLFTGYDRYSIGSGVHKLSLDPNFPPVRQKKRLIADVRNRFVKEEVI